MTGRESGRDWETAGESRTDTIGRRSKLGWKAGRSMDGKCEWTGEKERHGGKRWSVGRVGVLRGVERERERERGARTLPLFSNNKYLGEGRGPDKRQTQKGLLFHELVGCLLLVFCGS